MQQDQFQRLLPTFIQIIELTEQEESEYWTVVSAVFEGQAVSSVISDLSFQDRQSFYSSNSTLMNTGINNKVLSNNISSIYFTLLIISFQHCFSFGALGFCNFLNFLPIVLGYRIMELN